MYVYIKTEVVHRFTYFSFFTDSSLFHRFFTDFVRLTHFYGFFYRFSFLWILVCVTDFFTDFVQFAHFYGFLLSFHSFLRIFSLCHGFFLASRPERLRWSGRLKNASRRQELSLRGDAVVGVLVDERREVLIDRVLYGNLRKKSFLKNVFRGPSLSITFKISAYVPMYLTKVYKSITKIFQIPLMLAGF
jgi:hypothetical protein